MTSLPQRLLTVFSDSTIVPIGDLIEGDSDLLVYFAMQETSGSIVSAINPARAPILVYTDYPLSELLANGDFSAWTADDPDDWGNTESGSDPEISEVATGESHTDAPTIGGGFANMYTTGSLLVIWQSSICTVGTRYRRTLALNTVVSGTLVIGTGAGDQLFLDAPEDVLDEFVAVHTTWEMKRQSGATDVTFNNNSIKETNPLNGIYTGATVGQTATTLLGYSVLFDAVNDYLNFFTGDWAALFDESTGTLNVFAQSNTWAAGTDTLAVISADANNKILIERTGTDIVASYIAGGTTDSVTVASGSPAGYFMITMKWNVPSDAVTVLYNGVQSGDIQTGLGTWSGTIDTAIIGAASTTPTQSWSGHITRYALYVAVKTDAEILAMAQSGGVA